jgi:hypothetical protein
MQLIVSFMAIGAFCLVAAIIEAIIGNDPQSAHGLKRNKRDSDRLK